MSVQIRPMRKEDIDGLVQLSLLAFEPIFDSFAQIPGPEVYPIVYPDWKTSQSEGVKSACENAKIDVWVAELDGRVVGYIAYELHENDQSGEVQLLAVHPAYQNDGIGTALNKSRAGQDARGGDARGGGRNRRRCIPRTGPKIVREGRLYRPAPGSVL